MPDDKSITKTLVVHTFNTTPISQRRTDGYMDATAACKATNKFWHDYSRLKSTQDFLNALETATGIPVTELIQSVMGGFSDQQGTWVHPQVAVHLAQWCSPEFAVFVSKLFVEWTKTGENPLRKPRTLKPLTPAQRVLEEAKLALAQARIGVAQERFDRLTSLVAHPEPILELPPLPQLSVIQWLDMNEKRISVAEEAVLGKLCAQLSREQGRPVGQTADRRWRNSDERWKPINSYDQDILTQGWATSYP